MKLHIVALVALAAMPASAQAGARDDVVDVLVKCTDLTNDTARLACYDRGAPQLRAAAMVPPAVEAVAQPPATPETAVAGDSSWFGSLDPFGAGGDATASKPTPQQMAYQPIGGELLPITIGVTNYSVAPSGAFTVTLDNGQIWREYDRDFATPPFHTDRQNIVVISRGILGGYNLVLKGKHTLYKVVRVK